VAPNTRLELGLLIRLYLCLDLFRLTGKAKKAGCSGAVRLILRESFDRIRKEISGAGIGMG
jgi:hypothetical protein